MKSKITQNILIASTLMLFFVAPALAQNKNAEKGKETLNKAMEQTGAKRTELIGKAREDFQKAGLKPQEIAVLLGDAYLTKNDLQNAATSYTSASKDDKKEGLKKVAEAYVEQAFGTDDEKTQPKDLAKATSFFAKADASKEGARMIGDKFYEKGEAGYSKAVDYYVAGDGKAKVEQIAKEYVSKGGDNELKGAEVYMKLKNEEGAKAAGDIYYSHNEFSKAIEAYLSGPAPEGIRKYADYLYSENRNEEADNLIIKLADSYAEKKNDEGLEKLASEVMGKGSYGLAAKIYDKAENSTMAEKCKAYDALMDFRLEDAKQSFNTLNDGASVKMISDNEKTLNVLKDLAENLDDLKKGVPYGTPIIDSVTGRSMPSPSDQKTQEDYYKNVRDQVAKDVFDVSTSYAKLNNADLKKYVRQRFLKYGAVRNILDKETFIAKKQKQDIKTRDVIL